MQKRTLQRIACTLTLLILGAPQLSAQFPSAQAPSTQAPSIQAPQLSAQSCKDTCTDKGCFCNEEHSCVCVD